MWTAAIAGALAALLSAGVALLPHLVDLRPIKAKILHSLSERIHGRVEFRDLDLVFFPTPRLVAREGTLSIRGRLSARVREAVVVPELLSLAQGAVRVAWIDLTAPSAVLTVPELREPSREKLPSLVELEEKLVRTAHLAGKYAPSLGIRLSGGQLWLSDGRKNVFWFGKLGGDVRLPPKRLALKLAATSNVARGVSLSAELDPAERSGSARASLVGASLETLRPLLTRSPEGLLAADGNAELSVRWEGPGVWSGGVSTALSKALLGRGGRRLPVQGVRASGAFRWAGGAGSARVSDLHVASPRLDGTAAYSLSARGVHAAEFSGTELEVAPLRQAALSFAEDVPTVYEIFDILRAGRATTFSWKANGNSAADLGRLERMAMAGALRNGTLWLPWAGLTADRASGQVRISGAVLEANGLSGASKGSLVREGSLRVGLKSGASPLRLELAGSADLTEVRSILDLRVEEGDFARELAGVSAVQGRADGRVRVEQRGGAVDVRVDAGAFRVSGRYRRIPYPVDVRGSAFTYHPGGVGVSGLSGSVGHAGLRDLSGGVDWSRDAGEPVLHVKSGAGKVDLAELLAWFKPGPGSKLAAELRTVQGGALISALTLDGPARRPEAWRYAARGALQQVTASVPRFPGPVTVVTGEFSATPEQVLLTNARASGLDMSLEGSLNLRGLRERRLSAEGEFKGSVGSAGAKWVSDKIDLPEEVRLRCPLTFERGRLTWSSSGEAGKSEPSKGEISFSGNLVGGRGTRVSLSVRKPPGSLSLEHVSIADKDSNVSGALLLQPGRIGLEFRGSLNSSTLDNLFEANRFACDHAEGDFRADLDLERPEASSARGTLKVSDLQLPWPPNRKPRIEHASLRATGKEVEIDSASVSMEGIRIGVRGRLGVGARVYHPDLVVSTDVLDWEQWRKALTAESPSGTAWDWPVRGTIRVQAREFRYGGFAWAPLEAALQIVPGEVTAEVTRASVCGVATPATLRVSGGKIALDVRPAVQKGSLEDALECLVSGRTLAKGTFTLSSHLSASGEPEKLLSTATGEIDFSAEKGSILRYNLLSKVFSVLNVTEVLRGRLPDLSGSGFRFTSIRAKGKIAGGIATFSDSVVDGPAAKLFWTGTVDLYRKKLDLTVVVAPFKTVDAVLEKIPLVNYLLGRTLISIPVRVTGDWAEPTVIPLSPTAVGSGVLGLMQRTLTLPFKLIQPLLPSEQKPEGEAPAK